KALARMAESRCRSVFANDVCSWVNRNFRSAHHWGRRLAPQDPETQGWDISRAFVGTDGSPGGKEQVGYGYTPSWEASEIADWFSAIDGFIQCDGYAGYARPVELEPEEDDRSVTQTTVAVPDE